VKKLIFVALLQVVLVFPAVAQDANQAATKDPLSAMLRGFFGRSRENLLHSAEKVPENLYSMRPGQQSEVRTFSQIVGHLANFNYFYCANAKEEKNPQAETDFEKVTAKADLIKALNGAMSYCEAVYNSLTDKSAMQPINITLDNGKPLRTLRVRTLIQNISHNNEHYGNLVTYMRIKSIVPPSSEPRK
jgi:uncharacterized damage-inducible protein DinB